MADCRLSPLALCATILAAVTACTARETGPAAAVQRDSAGIAIVESSAQGWLPAQALTLAPEPTLAIGAEDEGADYQFGRIAAVARLADGRIAVFDGLSNDLRYFDAQGRFLSRTGGRGGGPGEYQNVSMMRPLAGDSLLIHDASAQRLTILAPDGAVARSVNLASAFGSAPEPTSKATENRVIIGGRGRFRPIGVFEDGRLLARSSASPQLNVADATRDSLTYVRLEPDGTLRDTIAVLPGDEMVARSGGNGQNLFVNIGPPPFGRTSRVAVDADGFWFGSADSYELRRYTNDGRLARIVRRPVEPLPVTPDDVEAMKQRELDQQARSNIPPEAVGRMRQMTEDRWKDAKLPATHPAHGELMVGTDRRLWVRETTRPADVVPQWSAFDADGRYLGTVAMPEDFSARQFGPDWVLGVQRDENDVEQVRLYALRPAGA